MGDLDQALETQLSNIESKTGRSRTALIDFVNSSSSTKHSELRNMVQQEFDLGYGDANTLVHVAKRFAAGETGSEKPVDEAVAAMYSGNKAELRLIHEAVMEQIHALGEYEIAPKKNYLSLRRKKQFATVGPASKGRVEVGLNMKGVESTSRLESLPAGGMCQYRVYLADPSEADPELLAWIKTAYDSAG